MRVLITGHDGYIGSVLTPMVRDAGHDVTGLDAFWFEGCALGPEPDDVSCPPRLISGTSRQNTSRASTRSSTSPRSPTILLDTWTRERTYEINHLATVRTRSAGEASRRRAIRLRLLLQPLRGRVPDDLLTESAPFNPVTPYGESKVLAERDLSEMADDAFSPVFLRNATVYGYSPRLRLDLVVNDFVANAFTTGEVVIKSDGTPWRPLVHVEDVARAALAAIEAPRETRPQRGLQHREDAGELPGAGRRGDRRTVTPGKPSEVTRTEAGPTRAVIGSTSPRPRARCPVSRHVGRFATGSASSSTRIAAMG